MHETDANQQLYKGNLKLSRPIVWYFLLTAICVFGRQSIFAALPIPEIVYDAARYGIPLLLFLLAMPYVKRRFHIWLFGLEVFFATSYAFSYLRGYMIQENILAYCVITLLLCIPALIATASMDDYEVLYKGLKIASFPIAVIVIIHLFSPENASLYSMAGAYQLVFTGSIHYNEVFRSKKNKWFYAVFVVVELVSIFVRGARGPLLCLIAFIAVKTILELRNNRKALVLSFIGILGLFVAAQNISGIMSWIGVRLNTAGLYSRNFQYLLSNAILNDSGRSVFRDKAIELIWQNPLIGYSASSDVKLLGGQYTHSLPIELMFDFGILVGGVIFAFITIHVIHSFFIPQGTEKDLRFIMLTHGYLMLFFSGTYLQSVYLFIFIGMAISSKYRFRIRANRLANNRKVAV
ncbi:MAG: hypothetical protein IJJ01_09940 [Firmicutes bacterium]|nr:hypothetical protein [Bacillota bacterium]